jgi:hypothetical protein
MNQADADLLKRVLEAGLDLLVSVSDDSPYRTVRDEWINWWGRGVPYRPSNTCGHSDCKPCAAEWEEYNAKYTEYRRRLPNLTLTATTLPGSVEDDPALGCLFIEAPFWRRRSGDSTRCGPVQDTRGKHDKTK